MRIINFYGLAIALIVMLTMFVFSAFSINYTPLGDLSEENAPLDDATQNDTINNDTQDNYSTCRLY